MFYICGKYKNRFLMKTVKLITCNDAMKDISFRERWRTKGLNLFCTMKTSLPYIRVV